MRYMCAVLLGALLMGCALQYKLMPIEPPLFDVENAVQPGHILAPIAPTIVKQITVWPCRYTVWQGLERFTTLACNPFGLPKAGLPKTRCFLSYGGVKIDGSESLALQTTRPGWWDYVYQKDEQWKIAWTDCGFPTVYDQGGTG